MRAKLKGGASVPASRAPRPRERERVAAGRVRVVGNKQISASKVSKPDAAAITEFKAQVTQWAVRIRVSPKQIRLQHMRRKWASCSTRGTVSFSPEVLSQPPAFREYVIVHELLHLKVPNHGKLFKTLLRAYIPNYETIQPKELL